MAKTGRKDDDGKLRYDLVPDRAETELVAVLTYGASKYGPNNWRRVDGMNARYFAAARRHLAAWRSGERIDPESGLAHLAHAVCSLMFLLDVVLELEDHGVAYSPSDHPVSNAE